MRLQLLFISLFIVFFNLQGFSQEYNFRHYDIKDGLAGLTVYSVAQDKEGFMWFATETGLSRFDGTHFKNFTTADGLPDNEIIKLFVDAEDRIWILPFAHAICYYSHGKLFNAENDIALSKMKFKSEPIGVAEDIQGNIIISENSVLHILDKNGEVTNIDNFNKSDIGIMNIGVYDQKIVVCAVLGGQHCFLFQLEKNRLSIIKDISNYGFNSRITILLNNNQKVFSYRFNFIKIFTKDNQEILLSKPAHFSGICQFSDTEFAINTVDSVYVFSLLQKKITQKFYIGKPVNNCIKDNEGNYWFVTAGYGIYKLASIAFHNYAFISGKNALPVYSIYNNTGTILVGTGQSSLWKVNLTNQEIILQKGLKELVIYSRITGIFKNFKQELFLASDNGIAYFNSRYPTIYFSPQSVKCVSSYGSHNIVSTNRFVYDLNSNTPLKSDTIWHSRATCAYKFGNNFYIGTLNGLYLVDQDKKSIYIGEHEPLLKSRISAMAQSNDSVIWIATYGNGILGYKDGKIMKHITEADGLTSNTCRTISCYYDQIWAGTDKGVNKIDISNKNYFISSYTSKDGLNCDIVNCMLIEKDTVYAGTPYGLNVFNFKEIINNSRCDLVITSFYSEKNRANADTDKILFPPGDKSFHINFTAISFKSEGNINYYYKLSGLDTGWQTTRQNSIEYATLSPGNYTLQLYAVNAFGKKSTVKQINFTIEKYFYQQNWFSILCVAAIALLIWFIVRKRIAAIRKAGNEKLLVQNRIAELEQMALRAQMNPHFIFNCLNSIQNYIFEKDVLEANIFIGNFASLMRQTLDISAQKFITLQEEIKYLETYLDIEQTRFEKSFDFKVQIDNNLVPGNIYIPPLLLQPFVENCIRHGIRNLEERKGEILVRFYLEDKIIFCIIQDNGIGRRAAGKIKNANFVEYQSKGVGLAQKRIDGINTFESKKIAIEITDLEEDGISCGTRVTLQFFVDTFQ